MGDIRVHDVVLSGPRELSFGNTRVRVEALGDSVEREVSSGVRFGRLVGTSVAMREVFAVLERIAASDVIVLVEGETGTGKELVADALHRQGPRAGGPFIAVDCGAIPKEALEAELFGVDKPADGLRARQGAFRAAEGGTLFLDEVAELTAELQAKLLRAIESREIKRPRRRPPGAAFDARVVVSTVRNLPREVKEGHFRQDLYYRLAAVVVRLPPLRSRLEDVPVLVDTILDDLNRRRDAQSLPAYPGLDRRAMELLSRYEFPGNVRELRNLVERFAVLGPDASALSRRDTSPSNAPAATRSAPTSPSTTPRRSGPRSSRRPTSPSSSRRTATTCRPPRAPRASTAATSSASWSSTTSASATPATPAAGPPRAAAPDHIAPALTTSA